MKEILLTIILGIIQGLTEFLPVSSSGHLTLFQEIFNMQTDVMFTSVMLHFGTLLSVIVFYFKDLIALFKKENHKTIWYLIIATIPAGIVMLLLHEQIELLFTSQFLCFGFLITAILLLVAEYVGKKIAEPKELTWKTALIMGTAQAFAVAPGISRSGTTITAGVASKGKRSEVANFTFFMSIPIIAGSFLFELLDADFTNINILATILGVFAAFISGYFAIKFMLKLIGNCNFKWFSLYLFLLSIITFINGFVVSIW